MNQLELRVQLGNQIAISVGRKKINSIVISDRNVSGVHCNFYKKSDGWHVADLNSTNGTYVNGNKVDSPVQLHVGDVVTIVDISIVFEGESLAFYDCADITVNIDESIQEQSEDSLTDDVLADPSPEVVKKPEAEQLPKSQPAPVVEELFKKTEKPRTSGNSKKLPPSAPYPFFSRSPRLVERIPAGVIEIEPAPETMAKPVTNWATILLSSFGMLAGMGVIGLVSGGMGMGVLYFIPMTIISLLTAVITHSSQKKKYKNEQDLLTRKYDDYLEEKEKEIYEAVKTQKEISFRKDPEIPVCMEIARVRDNRLWTRNISDFDGVSVRIGLGELPFEKEIKVQKVGLTLHEKRYQNDPQALRDKYKMIPEMPLSFNFCQHPTLGLVGDHDGCCQLLRSMVVHAATHYSYDELRMVFVFNENESRDWDWVRWLPHVWDESHSQRYVINSQFSVKELLKPIEEELRSRKPAENQAFNMMSEDSNVPFYLFFLISPGMLNGHDITGMLLSNDTALGAGCVILGRDVHVLPRSTAAVIEAQGDKTKFYLMNSANNITLFKRDRAEIFECEKFARGLAPVRVEGHSRDQSLPTYVTFMDGYNIRRPEDLDLLDLWNNARPERTMSVPIGIRGNGEKFYFDINEKAHGPHGLVAGTTGSGKSEMIQSWIISMAIQFSPEAVSFVLIDFKGTGLILPFVNLPHLAGKISDLDTNIDRNLVALEAELQRRKALFDEAGVSNISSYLELYHSGRVKEPLSYLFVIIDEYAEFKANFPDFTVAIDALFRTGRTLGVHIILLMQNPGGVVTGQSESNVRFRWCLKVASKIASKEVLEHPDAAKITNPGRAYVRVGTDEVYEQIQSFYSGGKYTPQLRREKRMPELNVSTVDITGKRHDITVGQQRQSIKFKKGTEIEALVNYIDEYTQRKHINRARPIWTEKMPDVVFYDKLIAQYGSASKQGELCPVVGLLDDPAAQKQYPFTVPLSENGHAVVYGAPGTGKSTFLYTLIYSICHMYTPDEVNLYLMDFGSWNLGMFKDYPHVGATLNDNEEEKIHKTIELLDGILAERKMSFSQMGVGSIQAYNYTALKKIPYIVLVIDNFAPVTSLYPELEPFFIRLAKEGGSYGVLLVSTANTASGLGFKIQQNIRTNICLQMSDPTDYSTIVGRTNGLQPDGYPGRGLYREDRIMEFQIALPGNTREDNARSIAIREEGKKLAMGWSGNRPRQLAILPEVVEYRMVTADEGITLGVDATSIQALGHDFETDHTLLISGIPQSGKTNLIKNIICQAKELRPDARVIVYSKGQEYSGAFDMVDELCHEGAEFDKLMPGISELLKERRNTLKEIGKIDDAPVYICIDGFKKFYEEILDDTADRLTALVQIGNGLKVYLIVAEDANELSRLRGMIVLLGRLAQRSCIMLGGIDHEHLIVEAEVPDEYKGNKLGSNEGYYLSGGKTYRFKAMKAK